MSESSQHAGQSGPLHIWVEVGLALLILAFGALVIYGSLLAGIEWAFDGPRAGFFPFYIGLIIVMASVANLVQVLAARSDAAFAEWGQLHRVLSVVVPSTVYVFVIPYIGIYVGSALLIGLFMKWLGRYGWALTLVISIAMPLVTFVVFERWFLVPLPKGPIEEWLGF